MIDYLVIGAVSRDLLPDGGSVPGGTVRYAAQVVLRLGLRPAIVTACHPGFDARLPAGIGLLRLPGATTVTFENRYTEGGRVQWLHSPPSAIPAAAIPCTWQRAPIVHLAPLMSEIQPEMLAAFRGSLVAVTPQGWLRRAGADGRVVPRRWEPDPALLRHAHAVIFSEEDVGGDEALARDYAACGPLVALTRAERGATIYDRHGGALDVAALPADPVDPTGAGDVFAAALLVALREGQTPAVAARWACAAAACAIEGLGTERLPDRQAIAACLQRRGSAHR